jgi:2-oxoisovalerate dehydrogenase E1 component
LAPLDDDAIAEAVSTTNKVLVLHEDNLTGGIGADIAAWIGEHCFQQLDAPVMRCASLDTPIPFNMELEKQYLANARLEETMQKLLAY